MCMLLVYFTECFSQIVVLGNLVSFEIAKASFDNHVSDIVHIEAVITNHS